MEDNATTVDVSDTTPVWSFTEPPTPSTGDYWLDLNGEIWKRFDGADFVDIDRMLIGQVVIDTTSAVAARSMDFTNAFSDLIDMEFELDSVTEVRTNTVNPLISVYGTTLDLQFGELIFDITTDLESPLSEAANTIYYMYITTEGERILATERPYKRAELQGFYHPYHSWRFVGMCRNDGSSDLEFAKSKNSKAAGLSIESFTATGTYFHLPNVDNVFSAIVGGGGGGGGVSIDGNSGGSSSIGTFSSATGGGAGEEDDNQTGTGTGHGGAGGAGSGGLFNINGDYGGNAFHTLPDATNDITWNGHGGGTFFAGQIRGEVDADAAPGDALDGNQFGGGGGGTGTATGSTQSFSSGGGGGGGTSLDAPNLSAHDELAITIGSGGTGGAAGAGDGGDGGDGVAIIIF